VCSSDLVHECRYIALPGDVNGDGTTDASDILDLITELSAPIGLSSGQTDIDRSGATGATDLTRLLDLINGGGDYESWFNASVTIPGP